MAGTASRVKLSPILFPQRQTHATSPFPLAFFRQCSPSQACRSHGPSGPSGPPLGEHIHPLYRSLLTAAVAATPKPDAAVVYKRGQQVPPNSSIIVWRRALYQAGGGGSLPFPGFVFFKTLYRRSGGGVPGTPLPPSREDPR